MSTLACLNEARRIAVRQSPKLAGFDYVEYDASTKTLTAYCLGPLPPAPLSVDEFRISGGKRIRDIRILHVLPKSAGNPELDDSIEIVVDQSGDFSTYTLEAVKKITDAAGAYEWVPNPDFDPQYNQIDFSFTTDCPSQLDCASETVCPPEPRPKADINYLAKDYATFRQLIYDRLAVVMPDWTNRLVPDIGVTLVELLAYVGDYLSYYQDAVATEAYLATARQRISVRRHARLVDYVLHEGCNARTFIVVAITSDATVKPGEARFMTRPEPNMPVVIPSSDLARLKSVSYLVFEAVSEVDLHANHDNITIYTWGDSECCLPKGSTAATLLDSWEVPTQTRHLKLKAGELLIFEEIKGPKTGQPGDRDINHRCAVRLTAVEATIDPLTATPLVNIEWCREDALPFPLCLSAIGPAPDCALLTDISVARGNVVLVDHGQSTQEKLPPVGELSSTPTCDCANLPGEVTSTPAPYRPSLGQPGLTYRQQPAPAAAASTLLAQDPHSALPQINLSKGWTAAPDLIESGPSDRNFTVEIDNSRVAWLRFGDGLHGLQIPAGAALDASYRVGNGTAGNVGAESIVHVVWDSGPRGAIVSVRNPMPARGGFDPQSIQEAKLFAPGAFRKRIERAITADDYANIAQREFPLEIQRAAAQLRWNGSWYEALVAIDAFGREQASEELVKRVTRRLRYFRRLGHDVRVEPAIRVPVRIKLRVCVKAVYLQAHVLADLEARFGTGLVPGGARGFFHPDELTFGEGLYLSKIVAIAQSIPGVESVKPLKFERLFSPDSSGLETGVLTFGPLEIAVCDSDPSFPEDGRIDFQMGGGR